MEYKFTFHALDSMKEDDITETEVVEAIEHPTRIRKGRKPGRIYAIKRLQDRQIGVTYHKIATDQILIITTFTISKKKTRRS
jgi:hypothetical protein